MQIAFIDGLGGGLMAQVISQLSDEIKGKAEIIALGTNALATLAMVKAGAKSGASGKEAICYMIKNVDLIVAPMGIVIPHAMLGEVAPKIAKKVAGAKAKKIFVPVSNINVKIVGLKTTSMNQLIKEAVKEIEEFVLSKEEFANGNN